MKQITKRTLHDLVETHLTSILSNSITIARHAKRPRRTIQMSDILTALKLEGTPLHLATNAGYTDNTPIDLNDFLDRELHQKNDDDEDEELLDDNGDDDNNHNGSNINVSGHEDVPSEMGMVMHWLAVEGKQPATPLNPINISNTNDNRVDGVSNYTPDTNNTTVSTDQYAIENGDITEEIHNENVAIRNLLPRLLSEELQLYFTRITLALQKGDTQAQDAALLRLRFDSGIQELVPFFFNFLTPTGNAQMADVQRSRLRIQCVHNLALNPHVHLELYLEKVVPLVLNCIVPKKLSFSPYDHWKLRDEASRTLLAVWKIFGEKYANFQSSVIRVLCEALSHGVESRYGALVALSDLGPKVVDAVVLPNIGAFWTECERELKQCKDDGVRFSFYRLQDALLVRLYCFNNHPHFCVCVYLFCQSVSFC